MAAGKVVAAPQISPEAPGVRKADMAAHLTGNCGQSQKGSLGRGRRKVWEPRTDKGEGGRRDFPSLHVAVIRLESLFSS